MGASKRRGFLLLAAAIAGLVTVGSTASFTVAASSSTAEEISGKIAFESNRSGTWNVYVANADGSALQRIAATKGYMPVWSPDGANVAFTSGEAIYVSDAEGHNFRPLTRGFDPAWSPNGTQLAFVRNWALYVINADGSGKRQLTRFDPDDVRTASQLPSWSPDGTRIAFERVNGLYVIGADGTREARLSASGVDLDSYARPRWSPDGNSIAFVESTCCARGNIEFYEPSYNTPRLTVIALAGGSTSLIAKDVDDHFAWSPDGTRIAYSRPLNEKEDAPREVYTTPVSGGASTQITTSAIGEDCWGPAWSPDGQWLTYMHGRLPARFYYSNSADIALIRADGTSGHELTQPFPSGGTNMDPVWAVGAIAPPTPRAASPLVTASARSLTSKAVIYELAASGSRSAVLTSLSDAPAFWTPPATRLTRARETGLDTGDAYGLVMTNDQAAWFSCFAHGVVEPVTDVSLVLTSRKTGRSFEVTYIERSGHFPPYETGPRLAGDGSLLVYNAEKNGEKLFLVDTRPAKPKLHLLAKGIAVVDVDSGHIVGWRGNGKLVTLSSDGRVLATATFARATTTSVRLEGSRLFTTTGNQLSQTDLHGRNAHRWELVDEGGGAPTLAGVQGDIAVYVSGVAVHVLRLSTGSDVVLQLLSPGPSIDVELTRAGLFYAYNAAYGYRPGNLGYIALRDLVSLAG